MEVLIKITLEEFDEALKRVGEAQDNGHTDMDILIWTALDSLGIEVEEEY